MVYILKNAPMTNLLLILLLLVGCQPETIVVEAEDVHGCLDSQACNYNANANIDNNSCYYSEDWEDECGVCDTDTSNNCVQDCNGDWGGSVGDSDSDGICDDLDDCEGVVDECGVCDGGSLFEECYPFYSILLSDENGNILGYEGKEGKHTNCHEVFEEECQDGNWGVYGCLLQVGYSYPNPFSPTTTIDFHNVYSSEVLIKIINESYNDIKTISSDSLNPGYYSFGWDGTDDSGNEVSDGYYRFIYSIGADECYVNIKKDSND